jgi:hypothetical protein
MHLKRALVATALVAAAGSAHATSSYKSQFTSTYGIAGTRLDTCNTCHPGGNTGSFTAYANDFRNNNHSFTAIESRDSDGDGFNNITEIRALTFPGDANDKPATAATCTSFTYSAWGACQPNGTQTRTVTASSPSGCTGGSPVITQSCTYTAPTCSSFTYSAWGACQPTNTQTRTVTASSPSGCQGGSPVLSQSCTYVPPPSTVTCPDADNDGFAVCDGVCQPAEGKTCGDCNDSDAAVNPGVVEGPYSSAVCSDGIDNNCNSIVDARESSCVAPPSTTGDWDLGAFRATGTATVGSRMYLTVAVTGTSGSATLTVYGTQNGNRIPVATRTISSAGTLYFTYTPAASGTITWMAEITDADPDTDRATASTWVFRSSSSDGSDSEEHDD